MAQVPNGTGSEWHRVLNGTGFRMAPGSEWHQVPNGTRFRIAPGLHDRNKSKGNDTLPVVIPTHPNGGMDGAPSSFFFGRAEKQRLPGNFHDDRDSLAGWA
jgi:hypothetical protein